MGRKTNTLLSECKAKAKHTSDRIESLHRLVARKTYPKAKFEIMRQRVRKGDNLLFDPLEIYRFFGEGVWNATKFEFVALDPRPENAQVNETIFSSGKVLGVEVTIPKYAKQCTYGNIDPQHTGKDSTQSAIEDVLLGKYDFYAHAHKEPQRTVVATIRPDLDSVGAMALLKMRDFDASILLLVSDIVKRVAKIAQADTFTHGEWPGPQPLPSRKNPWASGHAAGASDTRELAAIAAAVGDHKIPLEKRVEIMEKWLITGKEPEIYREQVEQKRQDMIVALENGEIKIKIEKEGNITFVESIHLAGLSLGYASSPVVIAYNPRLKLKKGESIQKFTIAQYKEGYIDLGKVREKLQKLEPGWGGSPTIIGSPQGVSSKLTPEQIIAVVKRVSQT